jgi:hypothetical protein
VGLVCGPAKEVTVMLDPRTAADDRLHDTGRWGYTGSDPDDVMMAEEAGGAGRWLAWVVLLAIAVIIVAALVGLPV